MAKKAKSGASSKANVDAAAALAAVHEMESALASLTEQINKGAISGETIARLASQRATQAGVVSQKEFTDYMGEEIAGMKALSDHTILETNRKAFMDDALFDLSAARKQFLRQVEMSLNNHNNQFGQNNAMSLNGVDKLQNIDIREGAGAAQILQSVALQLKAVAQSLESE